MALSGSFEKSLVSGHYVIRVEWSATQSVVNNTTTPTAKIYFINDYNISVKATSGHSLTINGVSYPFSSPAITTKGTHLIATINGNAVSHNADGSKSVSMSISYKMDATLSGTYYGTVSASSTVSFNTIARASTPTITADGHNTWQYISDDKNNYSIVINTNRAASSFTHTITAKFGAKTVTIGTGITTSRSWTIPKDFLNAIPNGVSATCTITCTTYNGSTNIGRKTATITLWVHENVKPTVTFTVAEANSDVTSKGFTSYLQSLSKLLIKSTGKGAYSSTIKSYQVTAAGLTYSGNNVTTNTLTASGTITVKVKVTDSRGRTGEATKQITVLKYERPKITAFAVHRCLADGTLDEQGTYCKVDLKASITDIANNTHNFSIDVALTGSTAKTRYALTSTDFTFEGSKIIPNVNGNSTYEITVNAIDVFYPEKKMLPLSTAFTIVDFYKDGTGISFGMVAQNPNRAAFKLPIYPLEGVYPVHINLESDLNDYHIPGTYSGGDASSMLNSPTTAGAAFVLEIYRTGSSTMRLQRFTTTANGNTIVYERYYNGSVWWAWNCISRSSNPVLWSGEYYMHAPNGVAQVANLAEPISKQVNGIILTFAPYYISPGETTATAKTWDNIDIFVSKGSVTGSVKDFPLAAQTFTLIGIKKLKITDTQIIGDSSNNTSGTTNGIAWDNAEFVLTKITGC